MTYFLNIIRYYRHTSMEKSVSSCSEETEPPIGKGPESELMLEMEPVKEIRHLPRGPKRQRSCFIALLGNFGDEKHPRRRAVLETG